MLAELVMASDDSRDSRELDTIDSGSERKPRGDYRCSKCGQLKRGHKCPREADSYIFVRSGPLEAGSEHLALLQRITELEDTIKSLQVENHELHLELESYLYNHQYHQQNHQHQPHYHQQNYQQHPKHPLLVAENVHNPHTNNIQKNKIHLPNALNHRSLTPSNPTPHSSSLSPLALSSSLSSSSTQNPNSPNSHNSPSHSLGNQLQVPHRENPPPLNHTNNSHANPVYYTRPPASHHSRNQSGSSSLAIPHRGPRYQESPFGTLIEASPSHQLPPLQPHHHSRQYGSNPHHNQRDSHLEFEYDLEFEHIDFSRFRR